MGGLPHDDGRDWTWGPDVRLAGGTDVLYNGNGDHRVFSLPLPLPWLLPPPSSFLHDLYLQSFQLFGEGDNLPLYWSSDLEETMGLF